jgi:vitamin B12 transporter
VESGSGLVRARFAGPLGFRQTLTVDRFEIDRRYGGAFPFEAKGGRTGYRWLAEQDAGRETALALGLEREAVHEDTGSGRETAASNAAFAILRWSPAARFTAAASLRYDDPERYDGRATARVSGRASLGQGFSVAGSWGQGFKTPSLFQSTYPCFECATPGPNRALKPERAQGLDATLAWEDPQARASASVTAYRLRLRNRIDYRFPDGYVNVARARSTGIEAQARVRLWAGFAARAGYAWTDAKDSLTGAALRVPRHSGSAGLDWSGGKADAAALVRAQSGAPDVNGRVRSFAVVELSGGYALTHQVRLTLRVENLLDAHYQQAFGYGEPGRSAYLGVALRY